LEKYLLELFKEYGYTSDTDDLSLIGDERTVSNINPYKIQDIEIFATLIPGHSNG
jgi:hypothetical protein